MLLHLWFDYMKKLIIITFVSKRFSNCKRKFDFSRPLKVWLKDGHTVHIAALTDAKILARLKRINVADDGVDFISLPGLNLSPTVGIQIKWGTRSDTDLVNWSAVKLIGVPSEQRSTRDKYLTQLRVILNKKISLCVFYQVLVVLGRVR